jgi:predicted amidophosphoribosyltransferase
MDLVHVVAGLVAPPLCAACGRACRAEAVLCTRCSRSLAGATPIFSGGPGGIDRVWSSAPHDGVARSLVGALKFRRLLPVAGEMAERMHWLVPGHLLGGAVVPVPAAPPRLRRRGFDPAGELAAALSARLEAPMEVCLARRGSGHQVGRRRAERIGHPPRIEAVAEAPRSVLLVDDVLTTGATLTACAQALRGAGARRIVALTFTRRL